MSAKYKSLQDKIDSLGNPAEFLRENAVAGYAKPVQAEFSNWRDEQRSWREAVGLLDQSLHMTDLYVEGPDTIRLLSDVAVNSFKGYGRNKAKQIICCTEDGYVIGDMVLFGLEDDKVNIVGRPVVANWIQYQTQIGKYDVKVERDARSVVNPKPRKTFRFQLQGPNAWPLLEKLNGAPLEPVKFFHMTQLNIAGRKLRALAHSFAGAPGLEFWGPWEQGEEIRAAIVEAGEEFGLRLVGGRAYGTCSVESGWISSPLQAIYTGQSLKAYREWLPGDSFEASASIGGSFVSKDIEDYYLTPWDLGYGRFVKFDHDFIGRAALEKRRTEPHREKVTLEWNAQDVLNIYAGQLGVGENGKFMEMPNAQYAAHPYDMVMMGKQMVGVSAYSAYLSVDKQWISLAMLDADKANFGQEVTVIWGEPNGGSKKIGVERHVQKEIRATVRPWPYSKLAKDYRHV
ncbi:MAG: aminomethyl transferase family protein [Alphaproteobacteria bacterium]